MVFRILLGVILEIKYAKPRTVSNKMPTCPNISFCFCCKRLKHHKTFVRILSACSTTNFNVHNSIHSSFHIQDYDRFLCIQRPCLAICSDALLKNLVLMAQAGDKMAQEDAKMTTRGPKMVPR